MAIELTPEARKQSIASIRRYFGEQLELDIGDLKAQLLLDFFVKEIGPSIHNAAVERSQAFLRDRIADLEAVGTEVEFAYWPRASKR